ncbi:MAG: rRNA maturation RNase YbeY [Sphingomonadaceae bacterium]
MDLEIDVEKWPDGPWAVLSEEAAQAAISVAPELANQRLSVSILFTSDEEIHILNHKWREKDQPTNVLSFPMLERDEILALSPAGPPVLLGDIVLASETCAREAQEKSVSLPAHAAHLVIHGFLHLAGYDHVDSVHEAEKMEALETMALAKMGIAAPYEEDRIQESD